MLTLIFTNTDFGPMLTHERNAQLNDDIFTTESRPYEENTTAVKANGKVIDLGISRNSSYNKLYYRRFIREAFLREKAL